jgi:hypothetical protein
VCPAVEINLFRRTYTIRPPPPTTHLRPPTSKAWANLFADRLSEAGRLRSYLNVGCAKTSRLMKSRWALGVGDLCILRLAIGAGVTSFHDHFEGTDVPGYLSSTGIGMSDRLHPGRS